MFESRVRGYIQRFLKNLVEESVGITKTNFHTTDQLTQISLVCVCRFANDRGIYGNKIIGYQHGIRPHPRSQGLFVLETSPIRIDPEGLGRRRTGTRQVGKGCFTYLQAPVNLFLEERAEQEETRDRGTTVGSYNKHRPFFLPVNRPSSQTNYGEHDR